MRYRSAGFTLLELMVAVAVAGILATLALPSFSEYLLRGRIPQAAARLSTSELHLEQYFQDRRTYAGAPECTGDTTSNTYFDFGCPVVDDAHFVVQAVGKGSMSGFVFSVDDQSIRRTVSVPTGWSLPGTDCWVVRRDGSC
jgi:type IV pilus assembly protein PilE